MKLFQCETCGGSIPERKKKCEYCGSTYVFDAKENNLKISGILCDSCGETNPPGTNYCDNCGDELTKSCKSCGSKFSKYRENCPNCGKFHKSVEHENKATIDAFYASVSESDNKKSDKLFHVLEKDHHNDPKFLSSAIYMYTKWGMSFDSDKTMQNYALRYRGVASDIISTLDKNIANHNDLEDAIKFFKENKDIKKEGCFIATEIYGGYSTPEVALLRVWRDKTLSKYFCGNLFITIYYFISPRILFLFKNKSISWMSRCMLDRFVVLIKKETPL